MDARSDTRTRVAGSAAAGLVFAVAGFVLVHVVFAYLVFWLAGLIPGRSIDSPADVSFGMALAVDLVLVALFGLQHSGMARARFKAWSSRWVAPELERSVYVWLAAAYWSVGVFYLLGVEQAWCLYRGTPQPAQPFVDGYAYRYVRNPQQLGLLIAFWSTPDMTLGRLVFAAAMSVYIVAGMHFERRDLVALHGKAYADYARNVPAVIPWRLWRR